MIVGIGYKKQSGKDTVGCVFHEHLEKCGIPSILDSFASGLKKTLLDLFPQIQYRFLHGSDEDKNTPIDNLHVRDKDGNRVQATGRTLMQYFGTEVCRDMYSDIWVKQLIDRASYQHGKVIICCDVRFKDEAAAIRESGGILIRVNRDKAHQSKCIHQSEVDLDGWDGWDSEVDNNKDLSTGLSHIEDQVSNIYHSLILPSLKKEKESKA